jgi:hypothetical protein
MAVSADKEDRSRQGTTSKAFYVRPDKSIQWPVDILAFLNERIAELIHEYNTALMNDRPAAELLDELSRLSALRDLLKAVARTKQEAKNRRRSLARLKRSIAAWMSWPARSPPYRAAIPADSRSSKRW